MDEKRFTLFLKKKGKKANVIDRNIKAIKKFDHYLHNNRNTELSNVKDKDIIAYVAMVEENKQSPKGHLYVLMNYFKFIGDKKLLHCAASLRQTRTEKSRSIFLLKNFLDVDQHCVKELSEIGIKNVEDMLEMGKTKAQRKQLAKQLDVPELSILELVKLSDITRLGYVKAKLSRLYYNAGLDSPEKIARFEPGDLHAFFVKFVRESGWDGMVPNPKDLVVNIASARKNKRKL